jgi:predicted alpha/beta-hydrolase family hydrolase
MQADPCHIEVGDGGRVSALFIRPPMSRAVFSFAHGAGANMTHVFMENVAAALAAEGIATLRFNFPFMESMGERRWSRPDAPSVAHDVVRAAARRAHELAPDLPMFAGGKSFGARMTSQAHAHHPLAGVRGLIFVGYPLHLAKKPSAARAEHMTDIRAPMLFVQGSRDALADAGMIQTVCAELPRASLHMLEGADHGFNVLVRSGRKGSEVIADIACAISGWVELQLAGGENK